MIWMPIGSQLVFAGVVAVAVAVMLLVASLAHRGRFPWPLALAVIVLTSAAVAVMSRSRPGRWFGWWDHRSDGAPFVEAPAPPPPPEDVAVHPDVAAARHAAAALEHAGLVEAEAEAMRKRMAEVQPLDRGARVTVEPDGSISVSVHRAERRTWRGKFAGAAQALVFALAVGAFLYVAYLFVDAGTRGQFTWPLRLVSVVAFLGILAAVLALQRAF